MAEIKPLIIVLDTNVLIENYVFGSHNMKNLLDFSKRTGSKIYLHKIVIDEAHSYMERNCSKCIEDINKKLRELNNWGAVLTKEFDKNKLMEAAISDFEKTISALDSSIVIISNVEESDTKEAVKRLTKRIPPSSEKGEEFRDVMIWLNMMRFCRENFNGSPIVFISKDKHFVDNNNKLKPELLDDLRQNNIDLEHLNSLSEFLKKHSSPVGGIDRYWILGHIDIQSIKKLIVEAGYLQDFKYYDKFEQQIELENISWNLELKEFYVANKQDTKELTLTFGVIINNDISIEYERSDVFDILFELVGNIVDDRILIRYLSAFRYSAI